MEEKRILNTIYASKGMISIQDAGKHSIGRDRLAYLAHKDELQRIGRGLYAPQGEIIDEYLKIQNKSERLVFSYHTALYFHDLTDRVPAEIHITVPQGYNATRLKKRHERLIVHYVKPELLELGAETARSPMGNEIILYDAERTICDLVKDAGKIDPQIFTDAMKRYFARADADSGKLIRYARKCKIELRMRTYMEVLL